MIAMFRQESINAGIDRISAIESTIKSIESELGEMFKIDKSLTKSIESIPLKPLKTDLHMIHRIQVKGKFDDDINFMKKMRHQISSMESRKEVVRSDKDKLYDKQDKYPHSTSVRSDIEAKDKEMSRLERDVKRIQEDVMKYYQSGIHTSSTHAPSESVSLNIPNNPSHDKGVTLIKSTVAYAKTHSKDYPDIIPYIERIADDCDETNGIHFEPPNIHDGYAGVDHMWLSRLKPELCAGQKVAYFFGTINFLAYFHKIQPKQSRHVLASNSSSLPRLLCTIGTA